MNAERDRPRVITVARLLARLAVWGLAEAMPEMAAELRHWLDPAIEIALFTADSWLRRRAALGARPTSPAPSPPPRTPSPG
jgi:hypothetical protein